ncbi:hypothetical protein A6V39_05085 [Candidatus Mycoplasma haematobovis]|uniref:Uncharacterized protein n=1 Tax=Candidatus Mycoplasma haematobovis TaxID=432608 RepID=A0A1A9QB63_9MOLU|nr:hypothetical protein [Candidatus Mycoplasma haematobovis]OAL09802.1 hypothetical protein A6V39_05085 [Candidatus Mycoplasma haematobovis]
MAFSWAKFSQIYTCCGSLGTGAYIYFLIPKGEASSVSEVLDRAGFTGIEKASVSDLKKLVAAYKKALEREKDDFKERIEEVTDPNASDEVIGEQIRGGCRRLTLGGDLSSKSRDTSRRFCVVPVTIEKTLEKQGFKFMDYSLSNKAYDDKWAANADRLLDSSNAPESLKKLRDNKDEKVKAIKTSCRDVAGAPTTSRLFNKFVEVARDYCSDKSGK